MPAEKKKIADATEQVEAAVAAGKETIEAAVKAGTDVAQQSYEKAVSLNKDSVEGAMKVGGEILKGYEDLFAIGQKNAEAFVQSSNILVKGLQDINKAVVSLVQGQLEQSASQANKLAACKTAEEAVRVQTELAKVSYDKAVAESQKISDQAVKLAEAAFEPISERLTITAEKLSNPLAA